MRGDPFPPFLFLNPHVNSLYLSGMAAPKLCATPWGEQSVLGTRHGCQIPSALAVQNAGVFDFVVFKSL